MVGEIVLSTIPEIGNVAAKYPIKNIILIFRWSIKCSFCYFFSAWMFFARDFHGGFVTKEESSFFSILLSLWMEMFYVPPSKFDLFCKMKMLIYILDMREWHIHTFSFTHMHKFSYKANEKGGCLKVHSPCNTISFHIEDENIWNLKILIKDVIAYCFNLHASFEFRISWIFYLSFRLKLKLNFYMPTKTMEGCVKTLHKLTLVLF